MQRRDLLKGAAAAFAAPSLAVAQGQRVLRFKPNADVSILDPVFSTAYTTRYLAFLSYDTLYGVDDKLNPHPQMAAGHVVEEDGRRWRITLREGLRFHDGEKVLAKDCVASLKRWGRVDTLGQLLMAATDEVSATSDTEITFRLKRPFPLLPNALGKSTSYIPVIMPERLVPTEPGKQVAEVVGSGPFRYLANEKVSGARSVWEKFPGYVPRPDGTPQFTSGPKVAYVDRVEWHVIPDAPTAAAALVSNEVDWYEDVLPDLLPVLRRDRNVVIGSFNPPGNMGILRLNHLQPPFDNPAIRRAVLGCIDQAEIMTAVAGTDPSLWQAGIGIFCPDSPMASDAGMAALTTPRDYAKVKRDLAAAGYKGERIGFLSAANYFNMGQQVNVAAEQMRRAGMNIDIIPVDFGVWLQRRASRAPLDQGGWTCTTTLLPGLDLWDPIAHLAIRGNGLNAWPGWPTSPQLESLRDEWVAAAELPDRQRIARQLQEQALQDVPYIPTGRWKDLTAYRRNLTGMLNGAPLFYNVRKG
ncbi:ABC transporter substrate-binding protein [Siccirubricoccus sp. KC 17139]|uniref:ABC transporter substrate-binding protein n=1 Tax=Siccirubricoccus soli TaxID=2899147 RepID=A0ABT1D8X1_9PROT|nr:ABC transporter substrate-binding protein [Siccirubricoccus soli]MCO6418387.1 ABC transporter substrate-binding protein [Siccirubricoccus soli]MCP2684522.1 ABC transporter substrate-binding protein [Siccirubricoccus soli]